MAIRPKNSFDENLLQHRATAERQSKGPLLAVTVVTVVIVGFLCFIWPTPWVIQTEESRLGSRTVRVNRFTGVKEVATPEGWK